MFWCIKIALLLLTVTLFSSCTTAEYQQARSGCAQIAHNDIPVVLEEFQCQKYRYIEVPTGETECVTQDEGNGRIRTTCKELTKQELEYFYETCTRDKNEQKRNQWINSCTVDACIHAFNNPKCETD